MVSPGNTGARGPLARLPRLSLRAKGVAILSVPMLALFAALFAIYWAEGAAREADTVVIEAHDTRATVHQFHVLLLSAFTALSEYAGTGERRSLADYERSRAVAGESLARLASLTADDPASDAVLRQLRTAAAETLRAMDQAHDSTGAPARAASLKSARDLLDGLQVRLDLLSQAQDLRLFRARYNRDAARQRLFRVVMVCGIIGPLGALFVHLVVFGRLVRRIQEAEENARRLAHGLPLAAVTPGKDEIASLGRQIEDAAVLLRDRERDLHESEARYRDLFDYAPIPYLETDREGVVRHFNQAVCELLKVAPDRLMGSRAWDFIAPDRQEADALELRQRVASGVGIGPVECEFLLEDGSRITVEIRETFIRNDAGDITGTCRSLVDVTERNLANLASRKVEQYALELQSRNEQLRNALGAARSAVETKSRFLAAVSHELRTPLNGIIGFSEMMVDGKAGPLSETHQEFIGDILNSARHLLRLINEILAISKVDAGKMEFRPEPCSIGGLVAEVRDVMRPLAEKKRIALAAEVPERLESVIDTLRFKQVLYNYLSNAVKFTPEGGSVWLRATRAGGGFFRVEVEDTGIGIPSTEIPLLFQEFQQVPNQRRAEQGTGLGLALTRRIVEAQGGEVGVRSVEGKGSVFWAMLPYSTPGNSTDISAAKL